MAIAEREYKGRKYLYADYTEMSSPQCIAQLKELSTRLKKGGRKALTLSNFQGAALDSEFMAIAKAAGKEVLEPLSERQALLGVDGLKKMLLGAYVKFTGSGVRAFASEQEALDYLVP